MNELFNFRETEGGEADGRKRNALRWATILMIAGAVYLAAGAVNSVKQFNYIGAGVPATNVISVSGEGEVFAVPDIAEISFSVRTEKKTVSEAQRDVTQRMNAAMDFIKKSGIEERDIKTIAYNAYPKYEYTRDSAIYPQPGKQVLIGYEVAHTLMVKVRDTEKAGAILEGLGGLNVTDISGPNFSIDDDQKIKADARKKAIADAKAKAEVLAKDLGVKLVRIINFSESGDYPIYSMKYGMGGAVEASAPATPDIPKGENKITSNVTISYEIR